MPKITKAVIAVAGYGTRFLPATKNQPKEMLPIVDKPIIQYLVEEAVASGIKDIIFVTRFGESALEDHFDTNFELEAMLLRTGKKELLSHVQKTYRMANFIFTRQGRHLPYGNGTPLLCVKNLILPGESFVYMFGDDMVKSDMPCVKQLVDKWQKKNHSPIIAVQEVPKKEVNRYGIINLKPKSSDQMRSAIEKPDPKDIKPPYLAQFGRFILNDKIINIVDEFYKKEKLGKGNELWLIDAIIQYAKTNPVYIKKIQGKWLTTGDPLRFMQTAVEFALDRDDIGKDFRQYLKGLKL